LLERKLTKEGLDTLCQSKKELVDLQAELKKIQEHQVQVQIPPK